MSEGEIEGILEDGKECANFTILRKERESIHKLSKNTSKRPNIDSWSIISTTHEKFRSSIPPGYNLYSN